MKTSSAKAKGRSLQKLAVRDILHFWHELTEHDVESTAMGQSGQDIKRSAIARKYFPIALECKYQEKLNIWEAIKQAKANSGNEPWGVLFRRNRHEPIICLDWIDFLIILRACNVESVNSTKQAKTKKDLENV